MSKGCLLIRVVPGVQPADIDSGCFLIKPNKGGSRMKKLMFLVATMALIASVWTSPVFAVRSGGTLNFMAPYGGDLSSLDPAKTSRYQDYLVSMNIHRSLYRWDPGTNVPVIDLAESVDVSEDGLTYTFKL
ncbi:MAG: hypothetical protein DRH26_05910, partial [Deltaproteobacteria bacterium]